MISFSIELGQLVHKLYLSSLGPDTKTYLLKRYLETDEKLEALSSWPVNLDINKQEQFSTKRNFQRYLTQHRNELDLLGYTVFDEIDFYTDSLRILMRWLYDALNETRYSTRWKAIVAYQKVVFCKEDAGIERALGSYFFSNGGFTDRSTYDWINKQINVFRHNYMIAQSYFPSMNPLSEFGVVVNGQNLSKVIYTYRYHIQNRNISHPSLKQATMWFDNMTIYIDQLLDIQQTIALWMFDQLYAKKTQTLTKVILTVMVMVSVLIMCPALVNSIIKLTSDIQSYAITLADKTKELNIEKRRTDSLLYQMMPKTVAEQLKKKQGVTAEYFKEVIYSLGEKEVAWAQLTQVFAFLFSSEI